MKYYESLSSVRHMEVPFSNPYCNDQIGTNINEYACSLHCVEDSSLSATDCTLAEVHSHMESGMLMDPHGIAAVDELTSTGLDACMNISSKTPTTAMWTPGRPPKAVSSQHTQIKASGEGRRGSAGIKGMSTVKAIGSLGGSHDTGCMEQLLVHCMTAIENNDTTSAQQLMWVLNNTVSMEGDPNQRVTAYFLKALISRAARMSTPSNLPTHFHASKEAFPSTRFLSAIELAGFVDLTPWHRFGFSACNGAIMEALEGKTRVHIVDFSITHCMQWPTLIESLSKRPHGPPHVRLTVHSARPHVPPLLNMSFEEVGMKLVMFARLKNVPFEFKVLPQEITELNPSSVDVQEGEILVINCQMRARYIYDEVAEPRGTSPRARFMRMIREWKPKMVTFVDEDADMGSNDMVSRLKAAFNYLWIPYDAMDTFLPRESKERMQYEGEIGSKIENIIACEGEERVERLESKERWMQRLRNISNLQSIQFSEAVVAEVKAMLEEHAAGWGLKKEGDSLLLTWKGHNVVFATACVSITS